MKKRNKFKKKSKKNSKKPVELSEIQKRLLKKKELIEYISDEFSDIQMEMVEDSTYDILRNCLIKSIKEQIEKRGISNEDDKIKLKKELTDEFNDQLKGGNYYRLMGAHREFLIKHDKYIKKTESIIKLIDKICDDDDD